MEQQQMITLSLSVLMTFGIWLQLCPTVAAAATLSETVGAKSSLTEAGLPFSSDRELLHHHGEAKQQQQQQPQVLFPSSLKQSLSPRQKDQHHRSSAFAERKADQSEVRSSAHSSSSLTPVHAADYNELRGKYGYFPPSMFRDFMADARERTFNTLYGTIDSKGMFHPANHLAHQQQKQSSSSSSLPMGSAPAPGSQSHHHNAFHSEEELPAGTLSQGSSHSFPARQYFDRNKMTDSGTYTPSYHSPTSSGRESTSGIREQRNNRQIQIGETLSSSASSRAGAGNQRSLGLLSHLMHHPHGVIPPAMMLMPPLHHLGHEMMSFMPPFHASPFHGMLPMHQLDHLYSPYARPLMNPYMSSPMYGYDAAFGMMPPAYPGMGIGYPGMYHRSTTGDGPEASSPATSGSHASQIHLSGGIYPPSFRQPHHADGRHLPAPSHSYASYPHLRPHPQHVMPAYPHPLPSHSPPPTSTLFPYSFQSMHGSSESRPDLRPSPSSSHKHDKHSGWMDEDEERGGSSPIRPTRQRAVSEVREAYEKAMIHNASKLTASPFFPYKRREDHND